MSSEDIWELLITGTRSQRKLGIDMTRVIAVEEINPAFEHDQACCLVFVDGIDEPYRVAQGYEMVFNAWKKAGIRTQEKK